MTITNEDLKDKLYQALRKLNHFQNISDLEQDPRFKEFTNMFEHNEDINNFQRLHEATNSILYDFSLFIQIKLPSAPLYRPKILETLLNNGVNINSYSETLNLANDLINRYRELFGYNTMYGEENVGYDVGHTLTFSIARIMLQNPDLLEKQVYAFSLGDKNENPLHSVMNVVRKELSHNLMFYDANIERENFKGRLSLLFTLMILLNPKSLEQKCHKDLAYDGIHEKTPMELFVDYLPVYNNPHMQELYNNFQEIIELTQDDNHALSQKIKELINCINSAKLNVSELKSVVSEIKDEVQTSGDTTAEKYIIDVGNLLVENLPTILLDRHISNLHSSPYQDTLKRELLVMFYNQGKYKINEVLVQILELNKEDQETATNFTDVFSLVLKNLNTKDLNNFTTAILGDFFGKIDNKLIKEVFQATKLLNKKLTNLDDAISHIKNSENSLVEKLKKDAQDFLDFKEFLSDNPAPHDTEYEKKLKNEKAREEALTCISTLFKEGDKMPLNEKNQNKFQITKEHVMVVSVVVFASILTEIVFQSIIIAFAMTVFLTTTAYCIDCYCNSEVDSKLTSLQVEGNINRLAV